MSTLDLKRSICVYMYVTMNGMKTEQGEKAAWRR